MTSPARALAAVTAATMLLPAPAGGQERNDARFAALVALTEAKMIEHRVPGVAIGIIANGVVHARGLGVTNVEDAVPVNDHTVDLHAPVRKYLPEFKVVRADGAKLFVQERPDSGEPRPEMPIAFFGPDQAIVTEGSDRGQSIEFIRTGDGRVNWVRVVGRVAVRIKE